MSLVPGILVFVPEKIILPIAAFFKFHVILAPFPGPQSFASCKNEFQFRLGYNFEKTMCDGQCCSKIVSLYSPPARDG